MSEGRSRTLEETAYEQEELWEEGVLGAQDEERVSLLAARVPADVSSLLDVGCGNGLFLRHLVRSGRKFEKLVGVDRSKAALKHVVAETVQASADQLPFDNATFDMVTCFEVIEHLPLGVYEKALKEIGRASRKYVLICVPYAEDLRNSLSTCPSCHTQFNVNYHLREYRDTELRKLPLPSEFRCVAVFPIGPMRVLRPLVARALALAERLRPPRPLPVYAVCAMCGYQPPKAGPNAPVVTSAEASSGVSRRLKSVAVRMLPRTDGFRWIAALYERHA